MDIKCENVGPDELPDLVEMVSSAFKYPDTGKISRDFPLFYTEENRTHLWVIRDNSNGAPTIASHSGSLLLQLYIEGMKIPAGGIGGVSSKEEFRGKGYAKELVNHCVDDLRSQGAALAFLWSGEHDFFRALGFELIGRQWSIDLPTAKVSILANEAEKICKEQGTEANEWVIEEGVPASIAEAKCLLDQHPLRVERAEPEFEQLISSGGARVFSAKRHGMLSAYLVVGKGLDLAGHIHEWAGSEIALMLLLSHVMKLFQHDLTLLTPQFTPKEAPLIYRLEKLGFSSTGGYMALVKMLNFSKVRELIFQKAIGLSMEPSFVRLEKMEDGTFCVGWATDPDIFMNEREFLKFIFGPEMPSQQLHLEENSKSAFDSLLPLRVWWWGLDSV